MPKGLLIQPTGDYEYREINVGLGSNDIRDAVGGNFDWADTTDLSMYCYEYALFERPVNPLASLLYWKDAIRNHREPMRTTSGTAMPLAGPTLVLGPIEGDMETDLPRWAEEEFLAAHAKMSDEMREQGTRILDPSEVPGPKFVPQPGVVYSGGMTNSAWKDVEDIPWEGNRRTGTLPQ